ncbi:MAG: riboflavin biosynthesis protein RibF [Lachnospiraceae bacterium]|nr:riboflavin biosynthesis protein RibF [Lachnospiraceae bacterium]
MKIIENKEQFTIDESTAVAIGKFDGVHLGHRALLKEILDQKKEGLKSAVLTFSPLPEVFFRTLPDKELSTKEEKRRLFASIGIDYLVEFPFNRKTAGMPSDRFISDILVRDMHAAYIAAGTDLSFGSRGAGNFALLDYLSDRYGYQTKMIRKVELDGKVISSTLVRSLVSEGRMEEAHRALGAPYSVLGRVLHGQALGRRIAIPTVNQIPEPEKLLPPFGVYFSRVHIGSGAQEKIYDGMTNIGVKPTVESDGRVTVETHLYDFSGDLYGQTIVTDLLTFRRPEQRFSGVEELKTAMERDLQAGRAYFDAHKAQ